MNKIERRIFNFIENYCGEFRNSQGVEFHLSIDDSIFVIHKVETVEQYIDFGLLYPCSSFSNFINDFKFESTRQVKEFKPDHLWEMYRLGKVEVYCTIVAQSIFHALYFKLARNGQMVVRDDYDSELQLDTEIRTPSEFIQFTENHLWQNQGNIDLLS